MFTVSYYPYKTRIHFSFELMECFCDDGFLNVKFYYPKEPSNFNLEKFTLYEKWKLKILK